MKPCNTPSGTYWRVQLVCKKVKAHSSLRTTTVIQSGPDAFDRSRFIKTFLTILGVTEILCSFRLVLEGKTGKEIPESSRLGFLEKFSASNFALSDAEDNTSRPYSRFTFAENTIGNLPNVPTATFLGSDGVFCFISICKCGSFKNPFATITSLSELYFRNRRFILLVHTKKVISTYYGSSTSSWKPWRGVRVDLILSMRDTYINIYKLLAKFTSSSRSTEFKVISNAMKWDILFWVYWKVNGSCDNNMMRITQCRESHSRTNTRVWRNK